MPACPHCGTVAEPGSLFCNRCGAPLDTESRAPPRAPQAATGSPARSRPSPVRRHPPPRLPGAGFRHPPVRVLAVAALILIVVIVALLLLTGGSPILGGFAGNNSTAKSGGLALPGVQCSAGMTSCNGACVNLQTDAQNCGACGFAVPFGMVCRNGEFVSPNATARPTATSAAAGQASCPAGQTSCKRVCRDLMTDPANCAACGYICPAGQTCQDGICSTAAAAVLVTVTTATLVIPTDNPCDRGQTLCGSTCVNLFTSKTNCGVCGRACGSQDKCVSGRCGPACSGKGETLCGDTCADLDTDANNCGSCGVACKSRLPNARGSECSGGVCIVSGCNANWGDCNEKVADGCEANLLIDANNCGSCGNACATGKVCYNRVCSTPITP